MAYNAIPANEGRSGSGFAPVTLAIAEFAAVADAGEPGLTPASRAYSASSAYSGTTARTATLLVNIVPAVESAVVIPVSHKPTQGRVRATTAAIATSGRRSRPIVHRMESYLGRTHLAPSV